MQIVAPTACNSFKSSITASPLRESRFPVGSSASKIAGLPASARDCDTLLLSTAELARQMFGPMAHPDAFERVCNCALAIARAHPAISQRQLHIFINGEISNQIETLENETDLAIANTGTLRE